jgi:hypothetical protein
MLVQLSFLHVIQAMPEMAAIFKMIKDQFHSPIIIAWKAVVANH